MLALTAATEPGPFLAETIQMGRYCGIRSNDGRLIAMAGERLKLEGFTEISAICTAPEFRGRGFARTLVAYLVDQTLNEGKMPFLHVKAENGAKILYQKLGFRVRRTIQLTVVITPACMILTPYRPQHTARPDDRSNSGFARANRTACAGTDRGSYAALVGCSAGRPR